MESGRYFRQIGNEMIHVETHYISLFHIVGIESGMAGKLAQTAVDRMFECYRYY